MSPFQDALWEDCRIAAFGMDQANPDLTLIDYVRETFAALSLQDDPNQDAQAYQKEVEWPSHCLLSGREYHIIKPIDCPVSLDNVKEFVNDGDVNKKFLQNGERYLTENKSDTGHHLSMRS